MQLDFHYYATYCAAIIAGFSHKSSLAIGYSSQFVDCCTRTLLSRLKGPSSAATTQLQLELMNARTDIIGLQDITRIWASFHFLPYDLYAEKKWTSKEYKNKYRLICNPNGDLVADTIDVAEGHSLQSVGIAMHVLADTWAHRYFAGTPSLVINNTNYHFYEIPGPEDTFKERRVVFAHNPSGTDDVDKGYYIGSLYQYKESSIMNLGHGRAGHLPDYSFIRYRYLPAWGDYEEITKDNPSDYLHAFAQMVYALGCLRGEYDRFEKNQYAWDRIKPWEERIRSIIGKRQINAEADWKAFGEELSGCQIEDFDVNKYQAEYMEAEEKEKRNTFLGRFFLAAMAQKSMVTGKIFQSGNLLAGISIDYSLEGFKGIKEFRKLVEEERL